MKNVVWNESNIADQSDKTIIITGSNSGIGFEAAKVLAGKNAEVVLAVRNEEKGRSAIATIKNYYPGARVSMMTLDLADLQSVSQFTAIFQQRYKNLNILINNAGVMIPPYTKTKDGFELQIGTNHFGHFALTLQLLDLLRNIKNSRIVNVSSGMHRIGKLNFDDLNWEKRKYIAWKAYGDSKIANLYFTYELKRRIGECIVIAAAHPGWTATDLQRNSGYMMFFNRFFAQNAAMGALPVLYAAVDPNVKSGDYFGPDGFMEMKGYPKKVQSNKLSEDISIAQKLWKISEKLTGITSDYKNS
ncbi:MAG: SDR family NAD(P)-dependent oxidoreductase [Calditrichaceae bacterium]|nr:SDR family NAD(P)-dependent oxidoreductase [Calditrichaceae bacterium]MBN2710563.1 SDR family NAD(P)-dependent oxidoreductase [Calditrichaceae bacterium]RQV96524.1 MAG: SDR family NAD(P)-dependent oxidoreductase [Calditrichota bacterium]